VAIDSAPPAGVFTTRWSFLRSNWPMISPFASGPHQTTYQQFCYAFVNGLPGTEQRAAYDRYVVPASRRIPRDSQGGVGRIDFVRPHAPLLLVAGGDDHIIPASLNRTNHARYRRSPSPAELVEFPGRNHFIIGQAGWEEVADRVAAWLSTHGL
jgi:pimeloyl-ACP methyl ester carboxylesterase